MSKLIKTGNRNYTVVSNGIVRDERISWKARGIFIYLWSQPDDWDFYELEIAKHSKDGRDALRAGLKELENFGYLMRKRARDAKGRLIRSDWTICDSPIETEPMSEKSTQVQPTLLSTNELSTNKLNTNQIEPLCAAEAEPAPWKDVLAYLNLKSGKKFRPTKANQRLIEPRFKDGFSLEDCKRAVDYVVAKWANDEKMQQYIRPSTIFRASNFEGYVQGDAGQSKGVGSYGGIEF